MTACHSLSPDEFDHGTFFGAIAEDLRMLSVLHSREPDAALVSLLRQEQFPSGLGLTLNSEPGIQAFDFLCKVIERLPPDPDRKALDELAADYAGIYLNHSIQASAEESVWVDEENLAYQDSMFQVRDWYARYGMSAPDWRTRPDDHLVLELEFVARLLSTGVEAERLREVARFMDEHLLRWLMKFSERVAARCDTPYFAGVAMLTGSYCEELRDLIADTLGSPRPSPEEIEERMRPKRGQQPAPAAFVPGTGPVV